MPISGTEIGLFLLLLFAPGTASAEETVGRATVVAETTAGSFLAMRPPAIQKLERDLATLADSLLSPEDPPVRLRILPNWRGKEFRTDVLDAPPVEIKIDAGILTFTQDASELAGLMAYHLARIRYHLERQLAALPKGGQAHRQLEEQIERYRKSNAKAEEIVKHAQNRVKLDPHAIEKLKAAKIAVDRLAAAGFNPWGALNPLTALTAYEREPKTITEFYDTRFANQMSTIDTEIEVLKNYLIYLESKEVDVAQQPRALEPLTEELSQMRLRAAVVQGATMGPAGRLTLGVIGSVLGAAATVKALMAGKALLDRRSAEASLEPEKRSVATAAPGILERLSKVPGVGMVLSGAEVATPYLVKSGVAWGVYRFIVQPISHWVVRPREQFFLARYRESLRLNRELASEIEKAARDPKLDPAKIGELAELAYGAHAFVDEGRGGNDQVMELRNAFFSIFAPNSMLQRFQDEGLAGRPGASRRYLAAAEKALQAEGKKNPSRRSVWRRAYDLAFREIFLNAPTGQTFGKLSFDEAGLATSEEKDRITRTQREMQAWTGAVAGALADRNLAGFLYLVRARQTEIVAAGGTNGRERLLEALEPLNRIAVPNPTNHGSLAELEESLGKSSRTQGLRDRAQATRKDLRWWAQGKKVPPNERPEFFSQLARHGLWTEAADLLAGNLVEFGKYLANPGIEKAKKEDLRLTIESLFEPNHWTSQTRTRLGTRLIRSLIFYRLAKVTDPQARLALTGIFEEAKLVAPGAVDAPLRWFYGYLARKTLPRLAEGGLLNQLDHLAEQLGGHTDWIRARLTEGLDRNRHLIRDRAEIEQILEGDHYWKFLSERRVRDLSEKLTGWERRIVMKYAEKGKSNPAFSYDPQESERIQTHLLRRFRELEGSASLGEKIEFWKKLARRGATGVTDSYFAELLAEAIDESGRARADPALARELVGGALDEGLVWDQRQRAAVYRLRAAEMLDGRYLDWRADEGLIEHRRNEQQKLEQAGVDPAEALFLVDGFIRTNEPRLRQELRLGAVDEVIRSIEASFPETGETFAELLDWASGRLETNHREAKHIYERYEKAVKSGEDLGASVVNELVNTSLSWPKAVRWQFIRWLRGTGEPPRVIRDALKIVGPETVRRLYLSLPVTARAAFITSLLAAPKHGLLKGLERRLYHEQILNEVLPREKDSAEIAHDLLGFFLKSVEKVSHAEKVHSVLGFLLAQPAENATTGVVLRNILENYGVPGVKLAQLLAATDILPEEVRVELAKSRDRANPPLRHSIYERVSKVLGFDSLDGKLRIRQLLGSASVKYAFLAEAPDASEHAVQVKREEAEKGITRNFKELEIVAAEMIASNPKRYSFFKGMMEATRSAIWRELSLPRESQRSDLAKAQYESLGSGALKTRVPATTDLISRLGGLAEARFALRSSEFVRGKDIFSLPLEARRALARHILEQEHEVLFPRDGRDTHFDPDRHPGNEIAVTEGGGEPVRAPIDWGQLLPLQAEAAQRVVRLMAWSQVFEHFGVADPIAEKLEAELGISESREKTKFRKALKTYFPNTERSPRSALAGYYHLLSAAEGSGFERNLVLYDLVKGIYQLEPYEAILGAGDHPSPKRTLAGRVQAETEKLATGMGLGPVQSAYFALTQPRAAATASRNQKLARSGKLPLQLTLDSLGLSKRASTLLMKAAPERFEDGAHLLRFLTDRSRVRVLSRADERIIERLASEPALRSVLGSEMTAEQMGDLIRSPTLQRSLRPSEDRVLRKKIDAPREQDGFVRSTGRMYAAEVINALFWSLREKDPARVKAAVGQLATVEKHLGFAGFAAASSFVGGLSDRLLPMSFKKTRYVGKHGVAMAAGMLASDLIRRMWAGEDVSEALDQILAQDNLREVAFSTAVFMAAEGGLEAVEHQAAKVPGVAKWVCAMPFRKLARQSFLFMLAEEMDRDLRQPAEGAGILTPRTERELRELGLAQRAAIEHGRDRALEAARTGDIHATLEATGSSRCDVGGSHSEEGFRYAFICEKWAREGADGTPHYEMERWKSELKRIEIENQDPYLSALVAKEEKAIDALRAQLEVDLNEELVQHPLSFQQAYVQIKREGPVGLEIDNRGAMNTVEPSVLGEELNRKVLASRDRRQALSDRMVTVLQGSSPLEIVKQIGIPMKGAPFEQLADGEYARYRLAEPIRGDGCATAAGAQTLLSEACQNESITKAAMQGYSSAALQGFASDEVSYDRDMIRALAARVEQITFSKSDVEALGGKIVIREAGVP